MAGWGEAKGPSRDALNDGLARREASEQQAGADATIKATIADARERLADPDTTLDDLTDEEVDELLNPVVDTFAVIVTFAQERSPGTAPAFADYDDAREAGIGLLRNHPDALSFSIEKRTSLQK